MSCLECRIDYLTAKTEMLETHMRLAVRLWHCSQTSSEVTEAQKRMVSEIRSFEEKWNAAKACPHVETAPTGESATVNPPAETKRGPGRPPTVRGG
jgi:hypothetical protein